MLEKIQLAYAAWSWLSSHYEVLIANAALVLGGLTAIALVVPGDHPDVELKAAYDWLMKYSRKPKDPPTP